MLPLLFARRLPKFGSFVYRELVEHSCFRCGAQVEDGTNFCPSCGAPQIRVAPRLAESESQPLPVTAEPVQPPQAQPERSTASWTASSAEGPGSRPALSIPEQLDWTQALPSAALGGICGAVLTLALMPLVTLLFPLLMSSPGVFSVGFYRRRKRIPWVPGGIGARLGVLAGAIGFVPFAIVVAVEFLIAERSGMMKEMMGKINISSPDPSTQQQMQHLIAWLQTPQGAAIAVVGALVFAFVGFLVLGTIGGAVWASMTGKRNPRAN